MKEGAVLVVSYPDDTWTDLVGPLEGVETVVWDLDGPAPRPDIDVVVAPYDVGRMDGLTRVGDLTRVRLVQLLTAGYEAALPVVPEHVPIANAAGVHDTSTAELAVGLALAETRGITEAAHAAARGRWENPGRLRSLADRRSLVIGWGGVGRAIARRLLPFEVTVTAVASRARGGDDLVEQVHGFDELPALLPEHDLVMVAVPLTETTRHLVDDAFLAALPDDALVVNVARGPVADTDALVRHAGRLAFGLDVTDPEPLPDDHPLFAAPRVTLTPHVGGNSTAFAPRGARMLREQLTRLAAGEPPLHVVRDASHRQS